MLKRFYASYSEKVKSARARAGRSLTYAEKVLFSHLFNDSASLRLRRGESYVNFRPDRVAMQDATAQMALLQFMNAGKSHVAVPATVHCDHLIRADVGVSKDASCRKDPKQGSLRFPEVGVGKVRNRLLGPGRGHHPSGGA